MILISIDNPEQTLLAVQAVKIAALNGDLDVDYPVREAIISEMHTLDMTITRELAIWNKEQLEKQILTLEREIAAVDNYLKGTKGTAAYAPIAAMNIAESKKRLEQLKQRKTSIE